ncbi:MAG: SGNH/GDSL hydrolase family protein [Verrucomicrobiaceae bacterium]|nr:SGNH/GDSL hydrolase family protein [Verrucomicrobiaceae bacterium]
MSLYFDNVVLTEHPEHYQFKVTCAVGKTEANRWTVTPGASERGLHPLEVKVLDKAGVVLEKAAMELVIVGADAGAKHAPLRVLMVGDSLTHATHYPNEFYRLMKLPGNPSLSMIGTHKPPSAMPGVVHEGYGGWTWMNFLSRSVPGEVAAGEKKKGSSPFLYVGADNKPKLDLERYVAENAGGTAPDVITFLLGINDCFGAKPDDLKAMDAHIEGVLVNADKLLAAFRAAFPKTAFAVGLTTPPNSRQKAFEANYQDKYTRWGWKRIQHRLVEKMLARWATSGTQGIYLVPTELNLDPVGGYPENNGVHPSPAGYAEVGGTFYAWVKAWLAGQAK